MLIFEEPNLRVYGATLPGGGLTRARQSVAMLVEEACPGGELIHAPDGAPLLSGVSDAPAVSVSHSGSLAILAVSREFRSIGIDTETRSRDRQLAAVMRRYLTPAQQAEWGADAESRLVAWCIKEAVYKCVRQPGFPLLSIPLPSVGFIQSKRAEIAVGECTIQLRLLPEWGHNGPIVSAACDKPCPFCR